VNVPTDYVAASKHPFLEVGEKDEEVEVITRKRGPLDQAFKMLERELADEAIACCFYANGLPFNLVRSPYWKEMLAASLKAPAHYISPWFEKVRTTLFQKEKISIDKALQSFRTSWKTFYITTVSNGWKDTRNRPLINVIAMMVGSKNVVHVVTDNAKNCRGAGALVESQYDHIFWSPCTIHSLNLAMQQIGTQIDWVKQIYKEGEEIQMFVTNHHISQCLFKSFSKLELLKVNLKL
jgi:hypothetical protein